MTGDFICAAPTRLAIAFAIVIRIVKHTPYLLTSIDMNYNLVIRSLLTSYCITTPLCLFTNRRLADGNVHCAGSATYQYFFRLPIPNPNPIPKPYK